MTDPRCLVCTCTVSRHMALMLTTDERLQLSQWPDG